VAEVPTELLAEVPHDSQILTENAELGKHGDVGRSK
jgi:hypothetical protein